MCGKKNLKIITGIDNFNVDQVVEIAKAADIAGATYIDVAANPIIVREVRKATNLPVCISSISLQDLYSAALEGIDVVEIGNYDYLYDNEIVFSRKQIVSLAQEAIKLFPNIDICVTIPHTLLLNDQIYLSCQLEQLGIKILQTEGINIKSPIKSSSLTEFMSKAYSSLSANYAISQAVKIPVIASSGMNLVSASLAILYGASGVGIATSVKDCINIYAKSIYIQELMNSMKKNKTISPSYYLSSIQNVNNLVV
uniref:hypothetical protein n=1 Tax=Lithothamnion corallioides TaxID=1277934 RepID=UPI0023EF9AB6|nr:hypothetical protein P6G75_pgp070 [Lithothamnion corallioides]WEA77117.1 hypothetical protein [Lithothamnion corallioides]